VERLIAGYDVIVDGTDNFDTRYVLNDAAVKLRKPVVHGSIYRWDGQRWQEGEPRPQLRPAPR